MKNQVWAERQPARSLPVPAGTKAGAPVKVGDLVGVLATDEAGGRASVCLDGGYLLAVEGVVPGPGTPVFLTDAGDLTVTPDGATLLGHTAAGSGNTYLTKPAPLGEVIVQVKAQV